MQKLVSDMPQNGSEEHGAGTGESADNSSSAPSQTHLSDTQEARLIKLLQSDYPVNGSELPTLSVKYASLSLLNAV